MACIDIMAQFSMGRLSILISSLSSSIQDSNKIATATHSRTRYNCRSATSDSRLARRIETRFYSDASTISLSPCKIRARVCAAVDDCEIQRCKQYGGDAISGSRRMRISRPLSRGNRVCGQAVDRAVLQLSVSTSCHANRIIFWSHRRRTLARHFRVDAYLLQTPLSRAGLFAARLTGTYTKSTAGRVSI